MTFVGHDAELAKDLAELAFSRVDEVSSTLAGCNIDRYKARLDTTCGSA